MKIINTTISEVKILELDSFSDERGVFFETYRDAWFRDNIADTTFIQDNHCASKYGVLRGLHYQIEKPQAKLLRVVVGEIFDVVVDLRKSSSTFGQWFGTYLTAENKRQLWIPGGFAHGYFVTSKCAEVIYKCSEYYAPEFERCIRWNDKDLNISWPLNNGVIPLVSDKDNCARMFAQADYYV